MRPLYSFCTLRANHEYYRETHLPLVRGLLGTAVRRAEIDRAIAGPTQDAPRVWMASGHLFFDTMEAFQSAFGPHAAVIMADLPNFTNVQPHIVISESASA